MFCSAVINTHGVPNNVMEHGSEHNRFKDVPAFPEVTLHPVSQPMQPQQQQQQQPTSLLHGNFLILLLLTAYLFIYFILCCKFSKFVFAGI